MERRRSTAQNRALHSIVGAFARTYPCADAGEWKRMLTVYLPLFLAEADGQPMPEPGAPESTSAMTPARCNEFIEFCLWIGTELGVRFRNSD